LGIIAIVTGSLVLGLINLVVGLVAGVLFMLIGIRWGGAVLDRRAPDLLQQLMRQR
jgi:ABC-2 type transport system permease protein